jgi:hypothetical protein
LQGQGKSVISVASTGIASLDSTLKPPDPHDKMAYYFSWTICHKLQKAQENYVNVNNFEKIKYDSDFIFEHVSYID